MPVVPGDRVVRALERAGFHVTTIVGSHHVMRHEDGRRTSVPVHATKAVKVGTLSAILRDVGWTADDLRKKL
jgi:predicted RNA binding protein YcfA (HicA-like mRNA interferase family)